MRPYATYWCNNGVKSFLVGCLYYPCSLGLTFYQQWFIKEEFHFPLFIVLCHYLLKFAVASCYRASYSRIYAKDRILLKWPQYAIAAGVTGIAASLDIGLSNCSFEYTTISLYTMGKSSSIIFMLIAAVVLSLESCNWSTCSVVGSISFGLFLFHFKATQFAWTGFLLVQLASVCGGIRWAASQKLMQKRSLGMSNPLDMIYHVQPWMIIGIVPLFLVFEGEKSKGLALLSSTSFGSKVSNILRLLGLIAGGGTLAVMMEILEYALVFYTSSLTLGICAIGKARFKLFKKQVVHKIHCWHLQELVTLSLAYCYKGDQISWINALGLTFCMAGSIAHFVIRTRRVVSVEKTNTTYCQLRQESTNDSSSDSDTL
ncbi:solute carrier family 35 member C2 [Trichuris trichiura]|uniref:Solute carrier family 35 member C2 n=1 Tax=Trichuris trichiura TaxID=36087 RepID=A0A077Z6G7_TRITR|nr:solute carrier family 35 member C2 [Trichuris trichiura]